MKQKFLLASVIVLLLSSAAKAQIGKGSVWLGGNLSFNSKRNFDDTSTYYRSQGFTLNPAIGKAISENTIMGIDLLYGHSKTKQKESYNPPDYQNDSYGVGIFIRRYVPIISRLYIFGHARAGVSFSKTKYHYLDYVQETKEWEPGLSFYPGVSFAVNKKLQLEAGFSNLLSIQYSHGKTTDTPITTGKPSIEKTESFSAGTNFDNNKSAFFIGFRLLLNNKG